MTAGGDQAVPAPGGTTRRGFACSGTLPVSEIATTARDAEQLGYDSLWITVLRDLTDPVAVIEAALGTTSSIEIGLGLVPLDAFRAGELAPRLASMPARTIVGLGVGQHLRGAPDFWRDGALTFRELAPDLRLCVGSYGAGVLRVAGPLVDAALLNWMTADRVAWARQQLSADRGTRSPCPVYVYVPAAIGVDGAEILDRARLAMARQTYHRRHQASLRSRLPQVLAIPGADARPEVPDFGTGAITVINPTGPSSQADRRALLRCCRPGSGRRSP